MSLLNAETGYRAIQNRLGQNCWGRKQRSSFYSKKFRVENHAVSQTLWAAFDADRDETTPIIGWLGKESIYG